MKKQIVIVGGGAGGLVLATRLAKKVRDVAQVTLVDQSLTHIWKPLLHEVAAGSLNSYEDEINYLSHGSRHGYAFHLGSLEKVDPDRKVVELAPIKAPDGSVSVPQRRISYDVLVLALGSVNNDFGTPGVAEHCMFLDSRQQADRFQQAFIGAYVRAHENGLIGKQNEELNIAIVGAGATGVELASELYSAARTLGIYGLKEIEPSHVNITLVEAAPEILGGQSESLVRAARKQLAAMKIDVQVNTRVVKVTADAIETANGRSIPATLKVWCAGIKAPETLRSADAFEVNRANQIIVRSTLQTATHDNIFALGDCAEFRVGDFKVPPRAQAAQQQANFLVKNIPRLLKQQPLLEYQYNDQGSFISFSDENTAGVLMGRFLGSRNLEGLSARLIYIMLYRKHQAAIHGLPKTLVLMVRDFVLRTLGPRLKLH